MLAKNTIRNILLERNLIIHEGPYHDHFAQKLPQFIPQTPLDVNKILGIDGFDKSDSTVIFESNPSQTPEEFKDLPRELDEARDMATPIPWEKKTHKYTKATQRKSISLRNSYRALRKYRNE